MQADSGSGLCGAMEASLSAPDPSVTHYFGLKLDSAYLVTLHYPFTSPEVLATKKGYICEADGKVALDLRSLLGFHSTY